MIDVFGQTEFIEAASKFIFAERLEMGASSWELATFNFSGE